MKRRKPLNHHISDYPLFKTVGLILTVICFAVGYWSFEYTYGIGIYSLVGLAMPCAMVMLWGFIKQRNHWVVWACFAALCVLVLSFVEEKGMVTVIITHAYWLTAFATCCAMVFVMSRGERHAREQQGGEVQELSTAEDPVKDAFLAELFHE